MIDGETYDIIKTSNCGLVCKSGKYKELYTNIKKIFALSNSKKIALGKNGFIYAKNNFDRVKQFKKANFFLESISKSK